MTDERSPEAVIRVLRLLGQRLEDFLDGDESAFESLADAIERGRFAPDDLETAVAVLRSLGGEGVPAASPGGAPAGKGAQRVLSAEERASLSPDAWGYLIDLKQRGSLDGEQFERVLELLSGCGVRPVDVDLAREVATRVALSDEGDFGTGEFRHGDAEINH